MIKDNPFIPELSKSIQTNNNDKIRRKSFLIRNSKGLRFVRQRSRDTGKRKQKSRNLQYSVQHTTKHKQQTTFKRNLFLYNTCGQFHPDEKINIAKINNIKPATVVLGHNKR